MFMLVSVCQMIPQIYPNKIKTPKKIVSFSSHRQQYVIYLCQLAQAVFCKRIKKISVLQLKSMNASVYFVFLSKFKPW